MTKLQAGSYKKKKKEFEVDDITAYSKALTVLYSMTFSI